MRKHASWALAAALTISTLAASCGTARTGAASAPACPLPAPRQAPGIPAGRGVLVRPGPAVVSICQYRGERAKRGDLPVRRIVLRGLAASGLAAVVSSAGPVTARARHCDKARGGRPDTQLLIFGYRHAPARRALIADTTCMLAVITAGGRSGVLAGQVESDLFFLSTIRAHARGPRTPVLIGLSARAAAAAARRRHFALSFDGIAVDRAVAAGTVIFQVLPAGVPDSGPGRQAGVLLAVRPAPACTIRQLALTFLYGGAGAGNDFGTLLIRDISATPCTLTGPVEVSGLSTAGRRVTGQVRFPVAGPGVLSPRAGPVTRTKRGALAGVYPGEFTGMLRLVAEYRDGPAGVDHGYCAPLWVVPATWRVAMPDGGTLTVANADPTGGLVPSGGFVTCRGQMGGIRPATVAWWGS